MTIDIAGAIALIQQAIEFLQTTGLYGFMQATLVVMVASVALYLIAGRRD
ncbi:MAG: hypothetical protein KIT07_02125 [Anaerolineales bacterium]|nr:hypothetical protein [Anaerolineales bacterium]